MPKQISALQMHNLWNIMTRNIPAAAVADWTDHFRRMNMGTVSLDKNRMFLLPDEAPKMRVLNETADIVKSWGDDYRTSLPGDISQKMDRQKLVINSFYNSLHEGMWEGAKALAEDYEGELPGLKKIYYTKMLENLYREGKVKNEAFQCVVFIIGYIQALYNKDLWLGTKGAQTAGELLKQKKDFVSLDYRQGDRTEYIPSGSVISHYGIKIENGRRVQSKIGHTFLVLKDLGDELLILEQAGELAHSSVPYVTNEGKTNLSDFEWYVGTDAYKGNTSFSTSVTTPIYESYKDASGDYILTMKPRIRKLKKSYFEDADRIRTPVIAAPTDKAVQEAVSMFGDKYKK